MFKGDQLGFEIYENGTITYSRNGEFPVQFLQLDSTYMRKPLWLIFDIYGSTKVIRILGKRSRVSLIERSTIGVF